MNKLEGVIVVGAGPVGFLTALGLARAGISVTLLEAEAGINESPRAAVYFPTTVRVLDRVGVLEDALAIGLINYYFCFRVPEFGEVLAVDTRTTFRPDEKFPYNLHFGQHILARIALQHLQRLPNTQVLWNTRVTALSQDAAAVTLTVQTPQGEEQLQADWVVGADGARSTVRHLLRLPFEGHTWPERFVATNVRFPFDKYGYLPANMIADPVNWAVVARLGRDDLWRVTFGEDASLPEHEVMQRIPQHYAKILPGPDAYEIVAASQYRVHERCAPAFRRGRVLLAGDAAHACNPCGGMGLTTGVIDANALLDVLPAVIAGRAQESVLDFYSQERRRVFLEVTSPIATENKRRMAEKDPQQRRQDVEAVRRVLANPDNAASTSMLSDLIQGRPML